MIVIWPGHVKPGSKSDAIVQSVDFHPTLLEMAGLKPAPEQKFDGISIVPALAGKPLDREAIFCHFPHYTPAANNIPGTWVRKGDWKLIRVWCDGPNQSDRLELYNLVDDIGETRDLSAKYPGPGAGDEQADRAVPRRHCMPLFRSPTPPIVPTLRNPNGRPHLCRPNNPTVGRTSRNLRSRRVYVSFSLFVQADPCCGCAHVLRCAAIG